jgi:cobalt-zinc-cadmium efflux system outer membrane protein
VQGKKERDDMPNDRRGARLSRAWVAGFFGLLVLTGAATAQSPQEPPARLAPKPSVLTLPDAVRYALENNPGLAAARQQRGIAAARVVIADTYPFNPVLENRLQGAEGPQSGGITNNFPIEHILVWEVELRHQGRYRREGAAAALSRTDWEIAFQEQVLAVQVIRAYVTLLYRQEKQRLIEETLRYNQQLADDIEKRLLPAGKQTPADLIVAQTEVTDTLDLVAAGREALAVARHDLYRALGVVNQSVDVAGSLDVPPLSWDAPALAELAVMRRADLQARRQAMVEADANLQLVRRNRFGNPSVGPAYTYDPSGVNSFGVQLNLPLPVANTHRGEILEAQAEQAQAAYLLRQVEVNVRQDVAAALARLEATEKRADLFRTKALPDLRSALARLEKMFMEGGQGADLTRLIDVRRKLLRARDTYLDAQWSVRQARADLLGATGEPALDLATPPPPSDH